MDKIKELSLEQKKELLAKRLLKKKVEENNANIISLLDTIIKEKPTDIALKIDNKEFSYADIGKKVDDYIHFFLRNKIEQESTIGVFIQSPLDLIVLFLSILKYGATLVLFPSDSTDFYISNSDKRIRMSHLLTDQIAFTENKESFKTIKIDKEETESNISKGQSEKLRSHINNAFCIMPGFNSYVKLNTNMLKELSDGIQSVVHFQENSNALFLKEVSSYSNIICILTALICGTSVHILNNLLEIKSNPNKNTAYLFMDTSELHVFKDLKLDKTIKELICFGEPVLKNQLEEVSKNLEITVRYLFMPLETGSVIAGYSTEDKIETNAILLGKPLKNQMLILNERMEAVLQGAKGEMVFIDLNPDLLEGQKEGSHKNTRGNLLKSGRSVRVLPSGFIELLDTKIRDISKKGYSVKLAVLETFVIQNFSVEECYITSLKTNENKRILAAFVIAENSYCKLLKSKLKKLLPKHLLPDLIIPISNIPLDEAGNVDEKELKKLPILDNQQLLFYEREFIKQENVKEAAFVFESVEPQSTYLHISNLLEGQKRKILQSKDLSLDNEQLTETQKSAKELKPSISYGDQLVHEKDDPNVLQDVLLRAAKIYPNHSLKFILEDGTKIEENYKELLLKAQSLLGGLRKKGILPSDKVIFQFSRNDYFIIAFWACILGGFIPVPVAKVPVYKAENSNLQRFVNSCEMFESYIVLTERAFFADILSLKNQFNLQNHRVGVFEELLNNSADSNLYKSNAEDLALIMLTSGSTGKPKGVMLNHKNLLARSKATNLFNSHTEKDISFNWMPLDHVGGLVMFHLRDVVLGCKQVHVPTNTILGNPLKWLDFLEEYKITTTWAPNFAFALVNDKAEDIEKGSWDLSSVRFILNGGEAIKAKTARTFLKNLEKHQLSKTSMFPSWGMSETCSGVIYNNFLLEETKDEDPFVVVGKPVPGFSMRIVDSFGNIVNEGEIGALQVKGESVTQGYYNNTEANKKSFTDDKWFIVGDLGFIQNGKLSITGREKGVIIINGMNYYSHNIESVVEELKEIESSYTAACPIRSEGDDTDKLAIFFVSDVNNDEKLMALIQTIKKDIIQKIGINPDYIIPVEKTDIPKTEIGKIQRVQLSNKFLNGDFNSVMIKHDLLLRNENTIPDWFYTKNWKQKKIHSSTSVPVGKNILIFDEKCALSDELKHPLKEHKNRCIIIQKGEDYSKLDNDFYIINPEKKEDYEKCLSDLSSKGVVINHIIHLWSYVKPDSSFTDSTIALSQNSSIKSLLYLIKSLHSCQGDTEINLSVISANAQYIQDFESANCLYASLNGFLKTVLLELPWISSRHIDLEYNSPENISFLLQEIGLKKIDTEVAYRNNKRLVPGLSNIAFKSLKSSGDLIKNNGLYVITGGLGGLGCELAKFLLKQYDAKLILLGRTKLPDKKDWEEILTQNTKLAQRIQNYIKLEKAGGSFQYYSADITNENQLNQALEEAEQYYNANIEGIFHLAGEGNLEYHWTVADKHMLLNESSSTINEMLLPKVQGTLKLLDFIKARKDSFFVSFSSVMGLFGGATFCAYSAANSCLENIVQYYKDQYKINAYCFSWSIWDNIGMSKNNPQAAQMASESMGYSTINFNRGIDSIFIGLNYKIPHMYIGLDKSKSNIRKNLLNDNILIQQISGFYTGKQFSENPILKDLLNRDVLYNLHIIENMPKTTDGQIDKKSLKSLYKKSQSQSNQKIQPRNEVESALTKIFKEVLNLNEEISIKDNFFDLGAKSVLLIKAMSRIQALNYKVEIVDLFNYTTIEKLSKYILDKKEDSQNDSVDKKAEKRKMRMQKRRQNRR